MNQSVIRPRLQCLNVGQRVPVVRCHNVKLSICWVRAVRGRRFSYPADQEFSCVCLIQLVVARLHCTPIQRGAAIIGMGKKNHELLGCIFY